MPVVSPPGSAGSGIATFIPQQECYGALNAGGYDRLVANRYSSQRNGGRFEATGKGKSFRH
jgi:hypothetical protein